ncbi:NAD(P)-dependent oxidoreductase [Arthrobacter sp. B1805]|uniref:NAD(P)-dependent oxidoreductase n=1 Tax=Arthrobacter sp. B1805 TaxID=2058892 RepID=UPI000CE34128|nr:NAD(P)-dependent oxidoreductase [Arthrobacter sp. B1805]
MAARPNITIIGKKGAGSQITNGLTEAGYTVSLFDPASKGPADGLELAVSNADLVFALGSSAGPSRIAERLVALLREDALYADLSTGTPATKRQLAALFPDGMFADAVIVQQDPVSADGLIMDLAGPAARRMIELLEPSGLTLRYVSEVPGEATARNLIRSLLAKGIAAAVIDCLWAAESMGMQSWAYQQILEEFEGGSAERAQQHLSGTAEHIKRRQIEIMDVVAMLNESGYESTMLPGIEFNYGRILHGKKIPFSKRP